MNEPLVAGLWVCQADCSYGPHCYLNPSEGSALPLKLWEIRPLEEGELTPGVQKTTVLSAGWWRDVLWMGGRLQSKEIFIHSALMKVRSLSPPPLHQKHILGLSANGTTASHLCRSVLSVSNMLSVHGRVSLIKTPTKVLWIEMSYCNTFLAFVNFYYMQSI